jgi:protein-S-isoprenylcysteine O-methyltransferase Ste14
MFTDVPLAVLALTVCMYWGTVVAMVVYKRLRHGRSAGLVPRNRFERRLWRIILPVVGAWIALPILAGNGASPWLELPQWAHDAEFAFAIRCGAAAVAVGCYLLSVYCWWSLGRNWSMAIVPKQTQQLVTAGPYRYVRHPIYGLSVTLMLASAVVLPIVPMAVVACFHLLAMNLKASHEEKHLTESFGTQYVQYCRTAGRFWPRWSSESTVRR